MLFFPSLFRTQVLQHDETLAMQLTLLQHTAFDQYIPSSFYFTHSTLLLIPLFTKTIWKPLFQAFYQTIRA